jgi:hypothetical protein
MGVPHRRTPMRYTSTRYAPPWVYIWEMHICKVQLAYECVYGTWEF